MTTICYKDGKMAGDTLTSMDHVRFSKATKVFKTDSFLIGFAGTSYLKEDFLKFLDNADYDKEIFKRGDVGEMRAIVVDINTREVFFYDAALKKVKFTGDFIAIGSGADFARGALEMGATPYQAVEIASKFDPNTNNEIEEVSIEEETN